MFYCNLISGKCNETELAFFSKAYSFAEKFRHQAVKFICISQVEVVFAIFKSMEPENGGQYS
jgi:hypothetical protein